MSVQSELASKLTCAMASDSSRPESTSLKHLPDEAVLAALRSGNGQALEVLYDRYAQLIYSLAYRILGNVAEAEDITQEVFLTFWQKDADQSSRGSLKTFLTTLARSRSIDKRRAQGTRYRFLQRWKRISESETPPLIDAVAAHEQSNHVRHDALNYL